MHSYYIRLNECRNYYRFVSLLLLGEYGKYKPTNMKFSKDLKATFLFSIILILLGLNSCEKSAISEIDIPETDTTKITFRGSSERNQLLKEFNLNYSKWKSQSISNYKIVEKVNCECYGDGVFPHELTVVNKAITGIKDENGMAKPINKTLLKTIEELFKFTETSLKGKFASVGVKYNSQYGYPESVYFDFVAGVIDEEKGYTVIKFSK